MSKRILALLLALAAIFGLLTACGSVPDSQIEQAAEDVLTLIEAEQDSVPARQSAWSAEDAASTGEDAEDGDDGLMPVDGSLDERPDLEGDIPYGDGEADAEEAGEELPQEAVPPSAEAQISEDGTYTSKEDVAEYIHLYNKLPANFITKNQARDLGWDNSKGNLWDVAPGKSIGGDRFGNYEGLLPEGVKYKECDVNYTGGYRGAERIIYGDDGSVYYTNDHYSSFEQLY